MCVTCERRINRACDALDASWKDLSRAQDDLEEIFIAKQADDQAECLKIKFSIQSSKVRFLTEMNALYAKQALTPLFSVCRLSTV